MSAIAAWAVRHARWVLAVSVLLAVGAVIAAVSLKTDAGTGTLVDTDTAAYRATQHVRQVFGEEPLVVVAEGDLQRLVLTANLGRLLRLEGCLSGKVPAGGKPIPGPCAELARERPVEFVAGPATFLNEAVIEVDRQLQRLAARMPPDRLREFLLAVAARYGITSAPSLANPEFIAAVVFDLSRSRGTPKARLAYLFPNSHSAQIVVRLRPGLGEAERRRALGLIRAAVYDPTPRRVCAFRGKPEACFALHGGRYVISGVPVVVDALARALKDALLVLFAVAVAVMALTLLLIFRSRFRLLPLGVGLAAAALTFGLFQLAGGSLTMASIAVLPILIGLAVDYAIQLQARYDEAVASGAHGVEAARLAASRGGPTIATACLATAAGFLALQLSPTPMVRGFGLLLVAGIAIAFLLALTAGFAALSFRVQGGGRAGCPSACWVFRLARRLSRQVASAKNRTPRASGAPGPPPQASVREDDRSSGGRRRGGVSFACPEAAEGKASSPSHESVPLPGAARRARRAPHPGDRTRPPERALALALAQPGRVLGIGLALAVVGWSVGTQIGTVSDIRALAPQSLGAVRDLNQVQDATGVSGQLEVSVRAPDLTDPATIRWMAAFKRRVLGSNGFSGPRPSCLRAEVCPGPALSDFLVGGGGPLRRRDVRAALAELPAYDLQQVAPVDPKTGLPGKTALLSFGIRAQSLERQQALIERVRGEIGRPGSPGGPPAGVEVQLAGLPVIAAAAAADLSASRYWLTLAGLAAVALALLAVYRSLRRAFVPLVPIVLATGWSALVLWASGIPLNPMSASLGALTIAIATEFSVILTARFHEERGVGRSPADALRTAYARTGAAVLASGATATAGFAVLVASDVTMLRDFGFVTVIDLTVALLGVMAVLPATLVLAEARER